MTPEQQDILNLKQTLKILQADNTRLTRENNDFKKLINDHAVRIDKNDRGLKNLERSLRSEMQRIAAGFKNVKTAISKITGGRV